MVALVSPPGVLVQLRTLVAHTRLSGDQQSVLSVGHLCYLSCCSHWLPGGCVLPTWTTWHSSPIFSANQTSRYLGICWHIAPCVFVVWKVKYRWSIQKLQQQLETWSSGALKQGDARDQQTKHWARFNVSTCRHNFLHAHHSGGTQPEEEEKYQKRIQ